MEFKERERVSLLCLFVGIWKRCNVWRNNVKFEGGHNRISGNYEVKFVRYYENREGASLAVLIDGHFAVHFVPAG